MKILHLMLACFYIDNYSYQENYLPKYHKLQGNDVHIVASLVTFDANGKPTLLPKADKYVNEYGIPVTRLSYKQSKGARRFRCYEGLAEELDRISPEVIFLHGVQFKDIDIVVDYCKKHPQVRVFADNHSDFSNSATNWLSKNVLHKVFWRRCAQKINPFVTKFYGVLPARVEFLANMYGLPREKIELLIMGADDECVEAAAAPEIRKSIREQYGIAEDDFLIMTGGKIDAFKTQTLLLMEAVQKLDNPKVRLVVFGSVTPELKEKVNALADGKKVQCIGWIQAKDSYRYFAACDLAAFPGRHSVFWEQVAAQSVPLLVKRWDGTTHVDICGNAMFLEQDSVEEISRKLEKILNPVHYAKIKAAAVEASGHFLYSKIAKRSIDQQ